jgi:hypothetical protein
MIEADFEEPVWVSDPRWLFGLDRQTALVALELIRPMGLAVGVSPAARVAGIVAK